MGERGVKFVDTGLEAAQWRWAGVEMRRSSLPGSGNRRDRRREATENRLARKHEARKAMLLHAAVNNAVEQQHYAEYLTDRRAKRAARLAKVRA